MELTVDAHPLLDLRAFVSVLPAALADCPTPEGWRRLGDPASPEAPLRSDDGVREAERTLLRHGGFKPTGRNKPSSEYLLRAATEGTFPWINLVVDAGNVVSLHSGLPVSVVDLDRVAPPLRVAVAAEGMEYVFNPAGQSIDVAGLLCLFDAEGPTANAVKDAQRTKTSPATRRTLSLIWGSRALPGRAEATERFYRGLLGEAGVATEAVYPVP